MFDFIKEAEKITGVFDTQFKFLEGLLLLWIGSQRETKICWIEEESSR